MVDVSIYKNTDTSIPVEEHTSSDHVRSNGKSVYPNRIQTLALFIE